MVCCGPSWTRKKRIPTGIDDAALAAELNQLSVQEREHIYEVVHGVAETRLEETADLVESKMKELREELGKLSKRRRRDYTRALFLKPSLAEDVKFHLIFLRADRFDCAKAAARLCKYFSNKLKLFGDAMLAKSITLQDLGRDTLETIQYGCHKIMELPDRAGRRVWFTSFRRGQYKGDMINIVSLVSCLYKVMSS